MQQPPRFAPFGPWKPVTTSSMLFAPFRGLGLNWPQPSSSFHFSPPAPASPPKEENIWGNNATGFALFMKRNIAPEMPRHPKYRYYYGSRLVPLPQVGLGRFLHTLQGNNNATEWKAEWPSPTFSSDGLPSPTILSSLSLDSDDAPHFPQFADSESGNTIGRQTSHSSWDHVAQTSHHRLSEAIQEDTRPLSSDNAIPPSPKFLLEGDDAPHLPQSADDELKITIGGPTGYLSWDHVAQTSDIYTFFEKRSQPASNSLSVDWHDCAVDQTGARGRTTLKLLFRYLNKAFPYQDSGSQLRPLSTLTKMSIKVPKVVRDLSSIDLLGQVTKEDDSIDLRNASNVQELSWSGDFGVFALKLSNHPFASLAVLSLTECLISVDDAVAIAHACPGLQTLTLETIVLLKETDLQGDLVKKSTAELVHFLNLTSLKVKSTGGHGQFIDRMDLRGLKKIVLHLDDKKIHVLEDFDLPTIPWSELREIIIVGKISNEAYVTLQSQCNYPVRCDVDI